MKFIIAVVMLAIAASAHAGIGPVVDVASSYAPVGSWGPAIVNAWGAHGHALGHALAPGVGPWGHAAWAASPLVAGPWGVPVGPWGSPLGAPHITLSQGIGHGPVVAAPHAAPIVAPHGHEAKYVASNRGSVHVAPLVGHVQSVSSTNVEPAPGTTW